MNIPTIIFDELKQYAMNITDEEFTETFPYFIEYITRFNMVQICKVTDNLLLKQCEIQTYNHNIRFEFDFNKLYKIIDNIFENYNMNNETNNKKPKYLEFRCLYKRYEISLRIFTTDKINLIPSYKDSFEPLIITKEQFNSEFLENLIKKCKSCYNGQYFILL
jgi:signal transduction histidine kinase